MRRRFARSIPKPTHVFLGLSEVAGYYHQLAEGLRALGLQVDHVTLRPHPFGYSREPAPFQRRVHRLVALGDRSRVLRLPVESMVRLALLVYAITRYDSFIFGYRNSFLIGWDLPLLRLFRKRVISVFHGSDSRPPYLDPVTSRGLSPNELVRATKRTWRVCRRFERWSHWIVCNPMSAHFFQRPVVIFQKVGTPTPAVDVEPYRTTDTPILLHAPSDLDAKGSPHIRAAITSLRRKGYRFEYIELFGRSNSEVIRAIDDSAFVIDQLYSDTTLAGFATEAAARGKASVVGGQCLQELFGLLGDGSDQVAEFTTQQDLETSLQHLLDNPSKAIELGRKARHFVTAEWSTVRVAERVYSLISDHPTDDWLFDPGTIECTCGMLPQTQVNTLVASVIQVGGKQALRLSSHPRLEALIFMAAQHPSAH